MPTVAADSLDDIRSAASRSFFLDAEELCYNAVSCLGGLVTSHPLLAADMTTGKLCGEGVKDCSLLLAPSHSQELSPMHSNAAMQFLLLDDEDPCTTSPAQADLAPPPSQQESMRLECPQPTKHYNHERPSIPYMDSTTLYCLAVVDEQTGLPLRPATPEETWEVERCFVLQQQCELLDPILPEQWQAQIAETVAIAPEVEQEPQEPQEQHVSEQDKVEEEEQQEEEELEESLTAAPRSSAPATQGPRRPEQQRRCGPCDNCGATESPQWRQGPASKPLLCNACGMRFRRTNQLVAGETGTASGARGRSHKKAGPAAASAAAAEPRPRNKPPKLPQPQLLLPDAKRPRRAAAVAAAATVAAAIDACS